MPALKTLAATSAAASIAVVAVGVLTPVRAATVPHRWANCTIVNQRLPHGVGLAQAHDHTSGTPVTSFRRDSALYRTAIRANGGLDRDHDGIACEKA